MIDNITIISAFNGNGQGSKNYEECAKRFVYSFNKNINSTIPIKLWCRSDLSCSNEVYDYLNEFDNVEIRYGNIEIPEPTPEGSWSSKIYALCDIEPEIKTKYIWWIDIDSYFFKDFEFKCKEYDFIGSPMNYIHNFGAGNKFDYFWKQYYNYFGLEVTKDKVMTYNDKEESYPYFTSASFIFKSNIGFADKYKDICHSIYYSDLPYNGKRFNQSAFPIVLYKYNMSYSLLPQNLNYLYHLNNYKIKDDTCVIHYCDNKVQEIEDEYWRL